MSVSRTISEIFSVKEFCDLETGGTGLFKSLKMVPHKRPYTTFYWSVIVSRPIALSCTIFELFLTLNNTVTLKSGLEVTQDHSTGAIRKLGRGFSFPFHSNCGSILHQFRDKARYIGRKSQFFIPVHSTPPLKGSQSKCRHKLWCAKTRMVWLLDGKSEDMSTRFDRMSEHDRQTHRRTPHDAIMRCPSSPSWICHRAAKIGQHLSKL